MAHIDKKTIIEFIQRIHSPHSSELFTVLFRTHEKQKLQQRVLKIIDLEKFLEKESVVEMYYCVGSLKYPLRKRKNKNGNEVIATDANSIGSVKEVVIDIDRKKSSIIREYEELGFKVFDMDVIMEIYRELGFFDAIPDGYYLVKTGGGFHLHYPIQPIVLNSPTMKKLYRDLVSELKSKVMEVLDETLDKILDARYSRHYDRYGKLTRFKTDMAENPYLSAAYNMKVDKVVGSLRQMVRVPGSINLKTGTLVTELSEPFPVLPEKEFRHKAGDFISLLKYGSYPKRNGSTFDPELPEKIAASQQKRLYAKGDSFKAVRLANFIKGVKFIASTTENFEGRRQNLLLQASWLCADAGYGEMTSLGYLRRIDKLFGAQKWARNDNELLQKVRDGKKYHAKRPKLTDEALRDWEGVDFSEAEKRAFGYYNRSRAASLKSKRQEKHELRHDVYHFVVVNHGSISAAAKNFNLARATVRSYVDFIRKSSITERMKQMERIRKKQEESENSLGFLLESFGNDDEGSVKGLQDLFGDVLVFADD